MEALWLVNGEKVGVDPSDRGLAYGDGLFETMACRSGSIRWLEYHLDRLAYGCRRLAIPVPRRELVRTEIESHCPAAGSAVVKLIVTRGAGRRGYAPPEPAAPTRILSIAPWSGPPAAHYTDGVRVKTCTMRLAENPQLAGLKHLCRLEQVMARMELTGTDAHEGLLRDGSGFVVGGIECNLFAVQDDVLVTPALTRCGVHGVMRRVVLEHAARVGLKPLETDLRLATLFESDELFLTNSLRGVEPVAALDDRRFGVGRKTMELMQLLGLGTDA